MTRFGPYLLCGNALPGSGGTVDGSIAAAGVGGPGTMIGGTGGSGSGWGIEGWVAAFSAGPGGGGGGGGLPETTQVAADGGHGGNTLCGDPTSAVLAGGVVDAALPMSGPVLPLRAISGGGGGGGASSITKDGQAGATAAGWGGGGGGGGAATGAFSSGAGGAGCGGLVMIVAHFAWTTGGGVAGESAPWDLEALRAHIQVQLERIEALNVQRGAEFQAQIDHRLGAAYDKLADQRDLFAQRMGDADRAIPAALISAEKAVTKAEVAAEARFAGVNEFRSAAAGPDRRVPSPHRVPRRPRGPHRQDHRPDADRMSALELRLTSRLDHGEGTVTGTEAARDNYRLNVNAVIQVLGLLISAGIVYAAFHR